MPNSRTKTGGTSAPATKSFRQRYDDLESQRVELIARLAAVKGAQEHPARRRALTLLNETFRRGRLQQRLAVLQAAAWLIYILEQLAVTM